MSFTGFHDPYYRGLVGEEEQPGPIVTLTREMHFDRVVLFTTPGTAAHATATQAALAALYPAMEIEIDELALLDPTDYKEIRYALLGSMRRRQEPEQRFVSLASGTPQMHATWLSLVGGGDLRATLLNTRPPKFVTREKPLISQVNVEPIEFGIQEISVVKRCFRLFEGEAERYWEPHAPKTALVAEGLGIIGEHPKLLEILGKAATLALHSYPILILGETGTGKELLARFVHHVSGRPADRFVAVNCAALPKDLVESTLFGHKKGSFTGAHENRKGKFDAADGGTLFLDELGELPIEMQPKLLRALQEGIVEPVGENNGHKVNVRIVAATNVDIEAAIKTGRLREDLFYRLKVGLCRLPPLRERQSDIQKIALYVLDRVNASLRRSKRLSHEGLAWLMQQPWRGNIRDLQNTIECAAVLTPETEIGVRALQQAAGDFHLSDKPAALPEPAEGFSMPDYLSDVRTKLIARALELADNNQARAAKLLGITPQALNKYLKNK